MLRKVLVLVFLFDVSPLSAANNIADRWLDLWTRCRVAIEAATPLRSSNLIDLGMTKENYPPLVVAEITIFPEVQYHQQKWGDPNSQFIVSEREVLVSEGRVFRGCYVELPPDAPGPTTVERKSIIDRFMSERERLMAKGNYLVRDPDRVADIALGVGPDAVNANGCNVISGIMMSLGSRTEHEIDFISFSGEQSSECGGQSILPTK